VAQVLDSLPRKFKALSSNHSTPTKKKDCHWWAKHKCKALSEKKQTKAKRTEGMVEAENMRP
jgi:hypothetical protein